jgi:hypothetical protein
MTNPPFQPFPVGTIRGPHFSRHNSHDTTVQFAVQGLNGWVTFIDKVGRESAARKRAEEYAAKITPVPEHF